MLTLRTDGGMLGWCAADLKMGYLWFVNLNHRRLPLPSSLEAEPGNFGSGSSISGAEVNEVVKKLLGGKGG